MGLQNMWNVGSSSVIVNQAKETEDKPSTSISMKVHCVCCATIPCWSTFTKNHSKQGHTNIHATLCLSEVRRSRVRVQLWADFKHSGQRMHNHHPAFCPGHQLWCHYKQSTCLQQKTKMANMLWNMMVTQQHCWRLRLLGSGAVLLGQQSPPVLWRIILPSTAASSCPTRMTLEPEDEGNVTLLDTRSVLQVGSEDTN